MQKVFTQTMIFSFCLVEDLAVDPQLNDAAGLERADDHLVFQAALFAFLA